MTRLVVVSLVFVALSAVAIVITPAKTKAYIRAVAALTIFILMVGAAVLAWAPENLWVWDIVALVGGAAWLGVAIYRRLY